MSQFRSLKETCVFMHDNTPSHVSKLTCEFFEYKISIGENIMEWSLSSPDLNLIENLWSLVKTKSHEGGKRFNKKTNLQEAIKTTLSEIEPAEAKKKKKKKETK